MVKRSLLIKFAVILIVAALPFAAFAGPVGKARGGGNSIEWQVDISGHEAIQLTVIAPNGQDYVSTFRGGQTPTFRLSQLGSDLEDGQYNYELRVVPKVPASVAKQLEKAREANDNAAARKIMKAAGLETIAQSGAFTILNGSVVDPNAVESGSNDAAVRNITFSTNARPVLTPVTDDQVIPDDLIVQGSLCVGFDCVNGESFGFDTIRLKENNTRIKFEDTSSSAGFPTTDWQLTANDSASGGLNKFSIEDITGAKVPVTVEGGATTNSLYVDSTGRIGFRTSTPVLDLHIETSNTPGIRLAQTNAGGFTAQTWDIAGNEANFFVRDVTSGSRLPFRIRPGAPTSSIDISAAGNVGVGTASPTRALHVIDTGATDNTVLEIQNDGPARIRINNSATAEVWNLGHQSPSGTGLVLSDVGDGDSEMLLDISGNMTITGTLTQGSSRDIKTDIVPFDPARALQGVRDLPILTWSYKADGGNVRHVGPMAEEFHAAFGFGIDDKHIAPGDQAGLALAAIKGLAAEVQQRDEKIRLLEERLAQLESAIAAASSQN